MTETIVRVLLSVIITLFLVLTGRLFIEKLRLKVSFLENLLLSFCIGIGLVGYLIFALGEAHLLYKPLILAAAIIASILLFGQIRSFSRDLKAWAIGISGDKWDKVSLAAFFIIVAQLAINFLNASGPIIGYDAPLYYLYSAKVYAAEGSVRFLPSHLLSGGPKLIEMIFTLGILVYDGILAALVNWWMGSFIVLGTYVLARKLFTRRLALLASAILISMPAIVYFFEEAKPTFGIHLFGFLSAMLFIEYLNKQDNRLLILSAVMAGFGMASSVVTGMIILTMVLAYIMWAAGERSQLPARAKRILLFLLIMAAIASPFYISNAVSTGNPFYPFFCGIFKTTNWNNEYADHFIKEMYHKRPFSIPYFLRFIFWDYTIEMCNNNLNINGRQVASLFLIFIPLIIFIRRKAVLVRNILIMSCIYFLVFYFVGGPQRRHSTTILPFLCFLTIFVISDLNNRSRFYRIITSLSVITFICYGLVISANYFRPRMPVVFNKESQEKYLSRHFDYYDTMRFANSHTPADSTILLIWADGYYCDRNCLRGDYEQRLIAYEFLNTPEDIISKFRSCGVDYIIVNNNIRELVRHNRHLLPYIAVDKIKKQYLETIYSRNNVDLYKVKYVR